MGIPLLPLSRTTRRLLVGTALVLAALFIAVTWPRLGGPAYACYRLQSVGGQWYGQRGARLAHLTNGVQWIRFDHARTGDLTHDEWASILRAQRHNSMLRHIQFVEHDIDRELVEILATLPASIYKPKWFTMRRCRIDPYAIGWAFGHGHGSGVRIVMEDCTFNPAESPDDLCAIERLRANPELSFR